MEYIRNEEKNKRLFDKRWITFERIVEAIENRKEIDKFDNPNTEKYWNQKFILVELNWYIRVVPAVIVWNQTFFKTAYQSRKRNKKYK